MTAAASRGRLAEDLYAKLTNEEDARVCKDISEEACRETPANFLLMLFAQFLTKLGDAIASPKTVLAWVAGAVGAPAAFVGFFVPIRESGSLIPQMLIAGFVRRLPVRKWVWVAGSVAQALAVAGLGLVALTLRGAAAGWAIVGLLIAFSLARGFCSVASKDVLGKTVPKTRRGQLTGWSASAAGLVTVGVGVALALPWLRSGDALIYAVLLAGAAVLWLTAAAVYAFVSEFAGQTSGGGNAAAEALRRLDLLRSDAPFRRFVVARALLMCSALSAPYYVVLGRETTGARGTVLGLFVVAGGLANLVSAPVWGRLADQSSRRVMAAAGLLTAFAGLAAAGASLAGLAVVQTVWFLPAAYFVLSLAHSGVRVGRKTYVVDLASGNRRTDYVAVSNSVIGVLLLVAGSVGALAPLISSTGVILLLSVMGLAGAALSANLAEVEG